MVYNEDLARRCAEMIRLAYDHQDLYGTLYYYQGDAYLVFRGTCSWWDVLFDIQTSLITTPEFVGCVHKGFYTLWSQLDIPLPENFSRLYITGHSLGGALAVLTSVWLADWDPEVYIFGAPRVGDPEFVTWYNQLVTCYNIRDQRDLIPKLFQCRCASVGEDIVYDAACGWYSGHQWYYRGFIDRL